MNVKRSLAIAATTVALGAGSLLAVQTVSADQAGNTLVDRLVERFNLNKDDVQVVVDEFRQERHAEREAKMGEHLTQAVENGKITEEQKALILQKHEENQAFFDSLKDMSEDERQAAMEQHREEMQTWAEENGIDMPFGERGHREHRGGPRPF